MEAGFFIFVSVPFVWKSRHVRAFIWFYDLFYAYNDSGSESEIDNDPEDTMTRDARRRLTQANRDNRQNQMNIMQELAQMKFVK